MIYNYKTELMNNNYTAVLVALCTLVAMLTVQTIMIWCKYESVTITPVVKIVSLILSAVGGALSGYRLSKLGL